MLRSRYLAAARANCACPTYTLYNTLHPPKLQNSSCPTSQFLPTPSILNVSVLVASTTLCQYRTFLSHCYNYRGELYPTTSHATLLAPSALLHWLFKNSLFD